MPLARAGAQIDEVKKPPVFLRHPLGEPAQREFRPFDRRRTRLPPACGRDAQSTQAEPNGRDAADVSFATMFGAIKSSPPVILIEAINDPANGYTLPRFCPEALSTHGGFMAAQ